MKELGEVLRKLYSKTLDYRKTDFSLNYLGLVRLHALIYVQLKVLWLFHRYWTDNGACYFNTTGSHHTNYEDLFVGVKEDADKNGIPYRYVQVFVMIVY